MTTDQVLLRTVFQNDLRHGLDRLAEFRAQRSVETLPLGLVVMHDFDIGDLVLGQSLFGARAIRAITLGMNGQLHVADQIRSATSRASTQMRTHAARKT